MELTIEQALQNGARAYDEGKLEEAEISYFTKSDPAIMEMYFVDIITKWCQRCGKKATFKHLMDGLAKIQRNDLAGNEH